MLITKSLFVDYSQSPKLAWWKYNDRDTYNKIQGLDDPETAEQMLELGQQVEDIALEYLERKSGTVATDLFESDYLRNIVDEDQRENADTSIPQATMEENISQTKKALENNTELLYQAGFQYNGLFVRSDFMVLNRD
ncbi:MAG: hypothetical protein U9Q15_00685 [Patescibacteria group bacterium]|nr:hypothetical protein [Patescibacteria group bacterium]